jgi:hypothetical protein
MFLTTVAAIATAAGTIVLAMTPLFQNDKTASAVTETLPASNADASSETGSPNDVSTEEPQPGAHNAPSEAQIKLAELLSRRAFSEIIKTSDVLFPGAGFRTRFNVYLMQGGLEKAERELDLEKLRASGYPDSIQDGYYRGWPILRLERDALIVEDRSGVKLAEFELASFLGKKPGKIWTLREMKLLRSLISAYEGKHPYCCLLKFLVDGYAPDDVLRQAELDLLNDRFEAANQRLNLLRLIDWEGSFTEVELLSVTGSLLEGDYEAAEAFAIGEIEEFDITRYGEPRRSFLELALALKRPDFHSRLRKFRSTLEDYTVEYPYYLHDGWFEQPVLEKWMAKLPESDRRRDLREAWIDFKSKHGMADLYSYMLQGSHDM